MSKTLKGLMANPVWPIWLLLLQSENKIIKLGESPPNSEYYAGFLLTEYGFVGVWKKSKSSKTEFSHFSSQEKIREATKASGQTEEELIARIAKEIMQIAKEGMKQQSG